jgi:hypothetical protein
MGIRQYRSLPEYVDALAWADASPEYFDRVEEYDALIESYRLAEDSEAVNQITKQKQTWTMAFKNAHPTFADKLMSSEGRVERSKILRESYLLIDHPGVQGVERIAPMREMLQAYQQFDDAMIGLGPARSKAALEYKARLQMQFQGWLGIHLIDHPELRYFYDRVLRPELTWDRNALDESMVS